MGCSGLNGAKGLWLGRVRMKYFPSYVLGALWNKERLMRAGDASWWRT